MNVVYVHASRFGNGAQVAEEVAARMAEHSVAVEVRHVREVRGRTLPPAELYIFSSPGRMGRPQGALRRLLKRLRLPAGTRYGLLTTEMGPQPDARTGRIATEEEYAVWERVRPIMKEILDGKGAVLVAEDRVRVVAMRGPLEERWKDTVHGFVDRVLAAMSATA